VQLAKFFNSGIERIVYEPAVRERIGVVSAGTVYTTPAWSMNLMYARLSPKGVVATSLLNSVLIMFRFAAWVLSEFCKLFARKSNKTDSGAIGALV
jgi:hypothetical protein